MVRHEGTGLPTGILGSMLTHVLLECLSQQVLTALQSVLLQEACHHWTGREGLGPLGPKGILARK